MRELSGRSLNGWLNCSELPNGYNTAMNESMKKTVFSAVLFCALVAAAGDGKPSRTYDIRDFGALGGDRLDTAAIQKAVDTAWQAGGGEVVVRCPDTCFENIAVYGGHDGRLFVRGGARGTGHSFRRRVALQVRGP